MRSPVDVMLSHDWPAGVHDYGDTAALLRKKKHFREDIEGGCLGNPASAELLGRMQPRFWFSGHLHVKFAALVVHAQPSSAADAESPSSSTTMTAAAPPPPSASSPNTSTHSNSVHATRFLALDKCLPGRDFMQIIDIPTRSDGCSTSGSGGITSSDSALQYDAEWLAIVVKTHALLPAGKRCPRFPPLVPASDAEIEGVRSRLTAAQSSGLRIPCDPFVHTVPPFNPAGGRRGRPPLPVQLGNPQTDAFLNMLGLRHSGVTIPCGGGAGDGSSGNSSSGSSSSSLSVSAAVPSPSASTSATATASSSAAVYTAAATTGPSSTTAIVPSQLHLHATSVGTVAAPRLGLRLPSPKMNVAVAAAAVEAVVSQVPAAVSDPAEIAIDDE